MEVLKVGGKKVKHVSVGRFLTYKGMVFTVPAALQFLLTTLFHSMIRRYIFVERQKDENNYDVDDENAGPDSGVGQPNDIDFVLAGPSNVSKRSIDEDGCDSAEKRSKTMCDASYC